MTITVAIRPVRDFATHHPQPVGTGIAQNLEAVQAGRTRRYIARAQRAPGATIDTAETLNGNLTADLARMQAQKAMATVAAAAPGARGR